MPFTLSHAAAALPFRKFKPVWPALVVGTFAPDLQYFIWISEEDRSGHHYPDVLIFTLPLALLVLWVFEYVVKGPVIEMLPNGLQRRVQDKIAPLSFWGWQRFSAIVFWTAVGIASHLVWDQFTHSHSRLAAHWSLLRMKVPLTFPHPMLLAGVLQDISTILGLLVLLLWCTAWYRRTAPVPISLMREFSPFVKVAVTLSMIMIALLAGYRYGIFTLSAHEPRVSRSYFAATVFEAITLVFCVELLFYGLARTVANRSRRLTPDQLDEAAADLQAANKTTSARR
jgi:Domain of unknown function (DUF4184)